MATYNVTILGEGPVGKSSLVCTLKGWPFNPAHILTLGADFVKVEVDLDELDIWDVSGEARYRSLRPTYTRGADIVLYCVDLSTVTAPGIEEIRQGIEGIRRGVPEATVILVATKSDLYSGDAQQRLNDISRQVVSDANIVTSALSGDGLTQGQQTLMGLIVTEAVASLIPSSFKNNLLTSLENGHATLKQQQQIRAAFVNLATKLKQEDTQIAGAAEEFVAECRTILEGEHPNIMNAVYTLAGAVVVTGIIALAGIGFGVAVLPFLITGGIGGAVTAGLLANSLFKEQAYVAAVLDNFSIDVVNHFSTAN